MYFYSEITNRIFGEDVRAAFYKYMSRGRWCADLLGPGSSKGGMVKEDETIVTYRALMVWTMAGNLTENHSS